MKRNIGLLVVLLALLALLSGYLTSKISFVGRVGVNTFYREYAFFKSWWQSALVFFSFQMLMLLLMWFIKRKALRLRKLLLGLLFMVALAGLFFTYQDFRNNLAHRWLGERFHLGIYLYWIGMMISCTYFLQRRNTSISPSKPL